MDIMLLMMNGGIKKRYEFSLPTLLSHNLSIYLASLIFQVDPDNVRPVEEGAKNALLEAERVAEATKQAIKRKIAQAASVDFQSRSLPTKLRIEPDDPEDVVSYKFYVNFLSTNQCLSF